jgi:hypothetical protein
MALLTSAGKNKLAGVFGVFFFISSFILLFWNEGRAVKTFKGLKEGAASVVSVLSDRVNPINEGKLIHSSGPMTTEGPVVDDVFQVQAPDALQLERQVEMFQWKETCTSDCKPGSPRSYEKEWSSSLNNSSQFQEQGGHRNPPEFPYPSKKYLTKEAKMNAFRLTPELLDSFNETVPLDLSQKDFDKVSPYLKNQMILREGKLYLGKDPSNPQIGDAQISYRVVPHPSLVSIIALQSGASLRPYGTKQGTTIGIIKEGEKSSQEMFQESMEENRFLAWGLRGWGFLMMFFGLQWIFRPIKALASVIPLAGTLVRAGLSFVAFFLAVAFSLFMIALAWVYYRPLIGFLLLLGTFSLIFFISFHIKKHHHPPQEGTQT